MPLLLLLVAVVIVGTDAFTVHVRTTHLSTKPTALQMKFLKDLGFEKPSWLPNFGGEKKEDEAKEDTPTEQSESSEPAVASTEEK
jgi:hypothetical protein